MGQEPWAYTGPTAHLALGGQWLSHVQLVPCWQQIPTDMAWGARQGQLYHFSLESWSTGHSRAAGKGAGPPEGAEEGCGAARAEYVLDSRATPRWVPVLPCLSLPSYGMGTGGRLWRQRGQAKAWSGVHGLPWPGFAAGGHLPAAPHQRCPWPWLLAPVLLTWAPGVRASASACGDGGGPGLGGPWTPGLGRWPALPAGSFSTRSPPQRPAAFASGERPCVACRQSR